MNRIEVCFSPGEYHLYEADFQLVVVLDVLRATSAICTAMEHGVKEIIPVASVEEARQLQSEGYLAAAERGGQIVDGFDMGNSPFSYMDPALKGKSVVLTTTNGTKAINMAKDKETVVIGSLNNLDALCHWLTRQRRDILVLGSGWKDKFNLEDTICAGAIADKCLKSGRFFADEDSTVAAKFIYRSARDNMFAFLKASSHRRRLRKLNLNEDVKYCLTPNNCSAIPVLENGSLVRMNQETVESAAV